MMTYHLTCIFVNSIATSLSNRFEPFARNKLSSLASQFHQGFTCFTTQSCQDTVNINDWNGKSPSRMARSEPTTLTMAAMTQGSQLINQSRAHRIVHHVEAGGVEDNLFNQILSDADGDML